MIWHEGWKAVTVHGPMSSMSRFEDDTWQLFHTDEDRAEAHDLAEQHPEKVKELDRRSGTRRPRPTTCCRSTTWRSPPRTSRRSSRWSSRSRCRRAVSTPTTRGPPRSRSATAANVHGVSYKALAEVEITGDTEGVIFASGSRFGGHSLFVKDGNARLRLQLPRRPAGDADRRAGARGRARTSSAWSSPRSAWVSTTSRTAR